jgi:1,4-dihydroxy-2-naphthoate octaprenyltransferase
MLFIFLGAFFYAVPPVRLEATGYGELTTSILVANLVPAFSLLLQTGEFHRLLAMATFPLTALHLAMLLAFELPDYGNDMKHGKRTLMVRLGWQLGMRLHNILILFSFLLLGIAIARGLPLGIALPAFLVLPLGLLQIWNMNRIFAGAKPHWNSLTLAAMIIFGLTSYMLTYSFWTR